MNNIDLIGIAVLFIIVALPFYILYKVIKSFEYQPIKTQISELRKEYQVLKDKL